MRASVSLATVAGVFGLLAIQCASAYGQEKPVSWNSAVNTFGAPVVRTSRQLVPNERIEIEVVKGMRGLKVGIGRTDGSPPARTWQPSEIEQGKTLSFTMSSTTQVGLGASEGDGRMERASIDNAKDSTVLSYRSDAFVLRVKVIRPGGQPAKPAAGLKPSSNDDKPAEERWEKAVGTNGLKSIRTKKSAWGRKITIKAEKTVVTRYVTLGFSYPNPSASQPDYPAVWQKTLGVSDKPLEHKVPANALYLGFIQIGRDPTAPEEPKIKGFEGYDKLTFDDGSVYIVKIAQ
jgi:hypothetical protein